MDYNINRTRDIDLQNGLDVIHKYYNKFNYDRKIKLKDKVSPRNLIKFQDFLYKIELNNDDMKKDINELDTFIYISSKLYDTETANEKLANIISVTLKDKVNDNNTDSLYLGGRKSRRKSKKSRKSRRR